MTSTFTNPASSGASLPIEDTIPDGEAYVLLQKSDGSAMNRNPFANLRELKRVCPRYSGARTLRSGRFLIKSTCIEETRRILSLETWGGQPVNVTICDRLNSCQGLIHSLDMLDMSEQEILEELSTQGVTEVTRLRSSHPDSVNPMIRLRFRGLHLPRKILCGYLALPVKPWLTLPRQCKRCWKHGHGQRSCRAPAALCGKCSATTSDTHTTSGCHAVPKCPLCSEDHPAWNRRDCRVWLQLKQKAQEKPTTQPDPDLLGPNWPALPSHLKPSIHGVDAGSQTDTQSVAQPALVADCSIQTEADQPALVVDGSSQTDAPPTPEAPPTCVAVTQTQVPVTSVGSQTRRLRQPRTEPAEVQTDPEPPPPSALLTDTCTQTGICRKVDKGVQHEPPPLRTYSTMSESSSPESVASSRSSSRPAPRAGPTTRSAAAALRSVSESERTPSRSPSPSLEFESAEALERLLPTTQDPEADPDFRRYLRFEFEDGFRAPFPNFLYRDGQSTNIFDLNLMYGSLAERAAMAGFYSDSSGRRLFLVS